MPRHYHVTEDQVFAIFVEEEKKVSQGSAPLSNSFPAIKSLLCCEQLSDLHKEALKSSHRRFKIAKSKHHRKGGYPAVIEKASKEILLEIEIDNDEKPAKKKPSKLKGLDELSRKQLKRRTDGVFAAVQDLAAAENVSVAHILGFLLTRSPKNERIRGIGEAR